uniref:Uncharacterized protein n=2 Tax=unclassified Caudoviricetes TaxID=2788787 RepID=A0A8S5M358_9CAUD|nr:MAG TPA: hypothetical protein [Siphoviridae sp. ctQJR51]DAD76717.1 MAG TPA: hypothetical protein [Siphoviridae sp. ctQJR51]DAF96548.1 MAG TPA: hypothetical protein [Siphoviridae sp. ctHj524]DAF96549.1 MAG TPA: hypothetical protein [Siphoviridae sp. ctHj524]
MTSLRPCSQAQAQRRAWPSYTVGQTTIVSGEKARLG